MAAALANFYPHPQNRPRHAKKLPEIRGQNYEIPAVLPLLVTTTIESQIGTNYKCVHYRTDASSQLV
jgi:hypothetical protein